MAVVREQRSNGAIGAPPPAISCLGAFRTPAARMRGWSPCFGVRKPAQDQTLGLIMTVGID
jgi:hypothetical protein